MPVTISGDGGIAGVTTFGFTNYDNVGTFTTSGGDVSINPKAAGRAAIFVESGVTTDFVGINTTTPAQLLHVSAGTPVVAVSGTTSSCDVQIGVDGAGTGFIGTETNNRFDLVSNSTTRLTVANNGNIGINNTNPAVQLVVNLTTAANSEGSVLLSHPVFQAINANNTGVGNRGLEIGGPSTNVSGPVYAKVVGTANRFALVNQSNNESVSVLNNGNVGIGTTNPTNPLDVNGRISSETGDFGNASLENFAVRAQCRQPGTAAGFGAVTARNLTAGGFNFLGVNAAAGTTTSQITENGIGYFGGGVTFDLAYPPAADDILDDYEEGTFIPTFTNASNVTGFTNADNVTCRYVKVGTLIQFYLVIRSTTPFSAANTSTAYLEFGNLPFSCNAGTGRAANGAITAQAPTATVYISSTTFFVFGFSTTANISGNLLVASVAARVP